MSLYQPNIPTGTVNLDVDYQNIQGNFSQLNTSFNMNHVALTSASNSGLHTFLQLQDNAFNLSSTGIVGFENLYGKSSVSGGDLFFSRANSKVETQLTGPGVPVKSVTYNPGGSHPAIQTSGQTYLPGAILMKFGSVAINGTGQYVVNYVTSGLTNFTQTISVTLTTQSANAAPAKNAVTLSNSSSPINSGFTFTVTDANTLTVYWVALGN